MKKVYKHKATGGLYRIVAAEARIERDKTPVVVYKSLTNGMVWVRPFYEFHDGRFELVTA